MVQPKVDSLAEYKVGVYVTMSTMMYTDAKHVFACCNLSVVK